MRAMHDVLALILAGGQGDRLSVLSEQRANRPWCSAGSTGSSTSP